MFGQRISGDVSRPASAGHGGGRQRSRWLVCALIAAVALVLAPAANAGVTRIGVNGARPSDLPILSQFLGDSGFTQAGWLAHASRVGENWVPGDSVVPLDYPAQLGPLWGTGAMSGDESLTAGQRALHAAILAEVDKGNTVAVAGLSLGTMVIDREIAYLQSIPANQAPPAGAVTFYIFGGESRGFGQMYARGVRIPLIGVTFSPVPETRYNTVVVFSQWDGWANPPDRPWNLLAVANAVMGAVYTVNSTNDHSKAAKADPADAILVDYTVNTQGGKTWTYMLPGTDLPLTRPLRQLGLPGWVVDRLDTALEPLIATGYSNMTPELGLHVADGRLRWKVPTAPTPPPAAPAPPSEDPLDGGDAGTAPEILSKEVPSEIESEGQEAAFGAEQFGAAGAEQSRSPNTDPGLPETDETAFGGEAGLRVQTFVDQEPAENESPEDPGAGLDGPTVSRGDDDDVDTGGDVANAQEPVGDDEPADAAA